MTTNNGNTSAVLDEKIALVSISLGMFGGYRRLNREQIVALGGQLPNSEAVTEGSIKVFPNAPMKPFHTIRRGLFRKVAAKGIKALGSSNVFAVPKAALESIEKEINDADGQYAVERTKLDGHYEDLFEAHVAKNPSAETLIRSKKVDRISAIDKLRFSHAVFSIQPLHREGEDPAKGVAEVIGGFVRQLFDEISADMADLSRNDTFTQKGRAGQKTLRPLKAAVAKMNGFIDLDRRLIGGAIDLVAQVLSTLPKEGWIEDTPGSQSFSTLRKLVETMGDDDVFLAAASKVANGIQAIDVLTPPPAVAPAPTPAAISVAAAVTQTPVPQWPGRVTAARLPPLPGMRKPGGPSNTSLPKLF